MTERAWLLSGLLLVALAAVAADVPTDDALDSEFLEFLGALEDDESWEAFLDAVPVGGADEWPEPVVARPEELDDDAG
jgi:hypothetical protein